jgi:type III secretory pathway component EscS
MHALLLEALYAIMILSLIPMLAIAFGAGAVALLQAVTQVQEQSIVHLARLLVIVVVIIWGGGRAMSQVETIFLKVVTLASHPEAG